MSKRNQKESKAYLSAMERRLNLIGSIRACTSESDFEANLKRYEKFRKAISNEPKLKTDMHQHEIRKLNLELAQLIATKKIQFPHKPAVTVSNKETKPQASSDSKSLSENLTKDPKRILQLKLVNDQLNSLSDKSAEFEGEIKQIKKRRPVDLQKLQDYSDAKNAIESIRENIKKLYKQYITTPAMTLTEFKEEAKSFLREDCKEVQTLNSHRGVKQIIANLLLAILSAGFLYGLAALAKRTFFPINPNTDSGKKLNSLEDSIANAPAITAG